MAAIILNIGQVAEETSLLKARGVNNICGEFTSQAILNFIYLVF